MAFGQNFLNNFFANDYVKDYRHASNVFRSAGYENSPRFKFLFHVYFNLNTSQIPPLRDVFPSAESSTIGLLVKQVDLPKFKVDTEVLNQYNRKRIIQKKIDYQPVTVKFHDDGGDLIRTMWYNYFSYYYKDPTQPYRGQANTLGAVGPSQSSTTGFDYNGRDIYDSDRIVNDWGFIGESYSDGTNAANGKPAFFKDISIYGFNQHQFVEYVLINPMITEWNHDDYDYSQGDGVMENSMTISFETVKYYTGDIGAVRPDTNVQGFGDPDYYDQNPSPLSRPGGRQSVVGQGSLLDVGVGSIRDLQVNTAVGGTQRAAITYESLGTVARAPTAQEQIALSCSKTVLRAQQTGAPASNVLGTVISPNVATSRNNILQRPNFPFPDPNAPCVGDPYVVGRNRTGG